MTVVQQPQNWIRRARIPVGYPAEYGYIPALDGLRLIAVTIVVIRHFDIVVAMPGGFGVSIFFFISGFLITRLLLAEEKRYGRLRLGRFYIRRFIRLLPPLLLMGAFAIPILAILKPEEFALGRVVLSFLYLGNISELTVQLFGWSQGWGELGPLWSLAVEEHFYLLLPPMLILVRSIRARIIVTAVFVVLPLMLRVVVYFLVEVELADSINYLSTPTRLDSLAWGVLLTLLLDAGYLRLPRQSALNHFLVWGGIAMMGVTLVHWSPLYEVAIKYTPQSLAIGIAFYGVLFAGAYSWVRVILEYPLVRHLGSISYEIYLWHAIVFTVVVATFGHGVIQTVAAIILSVAVSDVAYRLTTKRLGGLRKRYGGHPVT